jgi:hypothetical protein
VAWKYFSWAARLVFFSLVAMAASNTAFGQNATVTGTVVDTTGAVVAKANISVHNVNTNTDRAAESSAEGNYTVAQLPPGVYNISVTKDGFKTVDVNAVTLVVDQNFTLNIKLEVSSVAASVEVNAQSVAPVELQNATISNVIEEKQMTELPLILRDPYQLVLLSTGVVQTDAEGGVSVNGGRERNNNFMLDGVDNNDADVPGNLGGLTSQNPDSAQEFRVMTNNFAPEYGRNNGAVVDVITRSGANAFHGDAYYFGRWDALGARDFFNHQIDPVTGNVAAKNPYVRNLYGASLGGPIIKNKTFFFLNYEGDRFNTTLTNNSIVPTAAFRTGIFTYTNPQNGVSTPVDISTPGSINNAAGAALDPTIQKIFALYPLPNVPSGDGVTGTLFFPSVSRARNENATMRVDQKLSANNNLFVRYIFNWANDPNPFHTDTLPGGLGGVSSFQRTQGLSVGLTSTPWPTFINELRFGGNRGHLFFGCDGVSVFNSFGFIDPVGNGADFTPSNVATMGCQPLGETNAQDSFQGTYQTLDNMTKVSGTHTFKWGGEFRDVYSNNFTGFGSRELFTFDNASDFGISVLKNIPGAADSAQLEDMASTLMGLVAIQSQTQFINPNNVRTPTDLLGFRQHEVGIYGQDTWKIRSNLTLTYGLRWEYYGVPYEVHSQLSTLFQDPSGTAPFTFTPVGPGNPSLWSDYHRNFEPRFGFAWDPFKTGKTSVRGAIGVFSDRVYGNLVEDARGNPPFQPSFANFAGGSQTLTGSTPPGSLSLNPVVPDGAGIFPDLFSQNMRPPRIVTWNFGVQRDLGHNLTIDANYVGNHGTRILRVVDSAPPQPALVNELIADGVPASTLQFTNLYFGAETTDPNTGLPLLPFDPVNNNAFLHAFEDETSGKSFYDGLQLQLSERNFHGLLIQFSYTYSHALDNSSDPLLPTAGNGNFPVDSFLPQHEYGNSGTDVRQRGVINFVYQAPVGRGTSRWNQGFIGRAFEGWELSGIGQFQTGLPYDIFNSDDNGQANGVIDTLHTGLADRATVVGSSSRQPGTDEAFTGPPISAFTQTPAFGVPSNVGRNHWYGPGMDNWDFVLAKNTSISERFKLQLRLESYNIFNHVHFAKPDNFLFSPFYGESLSQVGQNDGSTGARQLQIGAKLVF